ncbi:MAG: biosynthetic-type acetolactate synthase large subunit [Deltaproteobacteria bacterium]|nr:biosynthetic-type acetolactate synthase large subunit [Deltaproteobacteria bacterium]
MELTGAQIFVESLKKLKVDTLFGYPGGAVLHIYDALHFAEKDGSIRHILVRHEQGAVHMADGYARATGKPGYVLLTSGPGATNGVTGIATAYMDSIPMVIITGQVPTHLIGNDAFQEADVVGITRPCTKHNFLVKDVRDLARVMAEAQYIATSGRPGPVLVDIPKDVTAHKTAFAWPDRVDIPSYRPSTEGHLKQVKKALSLILGAKRPVLYLGGGCIWSNAAAEVTGLARRLGIPVTQTLMGLGSFPMSDPLSLDMLGMHGTYRANLAMSNCDVLVAIGARFDDRVTGKLDEFCVGAKKIHVDIDPASISKNVEVDVPIVGDARKVVQKMLDNLPPEPDLAKYRRSLAPWHAQIAEWERQHPLFYQDWTPGSPGEVIKPQWAIQEIHRKTKARSPVVTTDVGQHQMWAAQYFQFDRPFRWVTSGGLGTMGFGLPAAIGAQFARPKDLVLAIVGDASVQMCIQELIVASEHKLPIKVFIINNIYLGMVRQWQEMFYDDRYTAVHIPLQPDWVKLADAMGAAGFRVEQKSKLPGVIDEALSTTKPCLVDIRVDPKESVFPMIPAGGSIANPIVADEALKVHVKDDPNSASLS